MESSSAGEHPRGRDRRTQSRLRAALRVLPAALVAVLLVGGAVYAGVGESPGPSRDGDALARDWQARGSDQVLGGSRSPGVPTVQRVRHDDVAFTVTVAPARPGPNLVRVDSIHLGEGHAHASRPVLVGTGDDDLVRARPRPGTDGLWAVVDLPAGSGTVLVTHGPVHRVPFAVETGTVPADPVWSGPDGPECLAATTAAILAGGGPLDSCPSASLSPTDEAALRSVVDTLGTRGVEQLAVEHDDSTRSSAAYDVVSAAAADAGMDVVPPSVPPAARSALLVVSGWQDAAASMQRVTALPLREQPIRTDGTWLAPWLLAPAVVDSTLGAVVPLDFDIRDPDAQEFSQTLARYLPGQAPTGSAFLAWRTQRGDEAAPLRLFAASRAAYMPAHGHHAGHETTVAWFPGGTVTPIGPPSG